MPRSGFRFDEHSGVRILRLWSDDGTNRMTRECVLSLTDAVAKVALENQPLVLAGNDRFFSAGADLNEISVLDAPRLMNFPRWGRP
jgi:enoyl-CoA hydratase/carnithine racemase